MKRERDVKDRIRYHLRTAGAWYCMPHGAGYGLPGIPDIIVCHRGLMIAIEAKFGGSKLSPQQELRKAEIETAGGTWWTVDESNVDQLPARLAGVAR